MKYSASNVNFSSQSFDPLSLRRLAHASVKKGYPCKTGYFTDIGSFNVKTVADRHRLAANHNKHW